MRNVSQAYYHKKNTFFLVYFKEQISKPIIPVSINNNSTINIFFSENYKSVIPGKISCPYIINIGHSNNYKIK